MTRKDWDKCIEAGQRAYLCEQFFANQKRLNDWAMAYEREQDRKRLTARQSEDA